MRERGSGSLRLRGRIWWLRYFHQGKLVEESSKTSDEAEARKLLRQKLKKADTVLFVAPQAERVTFEDLCDLIRRDYARKGNRSRIEQRLAHPLRVFAGRRALSITDEEIEQMIDARSAAGASDATANRDAAAVRHMFRLAVKKKILPKAAGRTSNSGGRTTPAMTSSSPATWTRSSGRSASGSPSSPTARSSPSARVSGGRTSSASSGPGYSSRWRPATSSGASCGSAGR